MVERKCSEQRCNFHHGTQMWSVKVVDLSVTRVEFFINCFIPNPAPILWSVKVWGSRYLRLMLKPDIIIISSLNCWTYEMKLKRSSRQDFFGIIEREIDKGDGNGKDKTEMNQLTLGKKIFANVITACLRIVTSGVRPNTWPPTSGLRQNSWLPTLDQTPDLRPNSWPPPSDQIPDLRPSGLRRPEV